MEQSNHAKNVDPVMLKPHFNGWQLIKTYWQSKERFRAYLLFAFVLLMTISIVGIDVLFNYWYNSFYNALQAYDVNNTVRLLGVFCVLAAIAIILAVYRYYINQLLSLRWRRWLTEQLVARWLEKRGYYYLENFNENTDNPDQRIQDDAGTLVTNSLDLITGLVSSVATVFAFLYILWSLSGVITIPLGSYGYLKITGYLVWVSILYSLIGTFIAFRIGKPLVHLNFEQQRREATFRHAAIDLRTHSENVALYRGEEHQTSILRRLLDKVLGNWYMIILQQKRLLWFTAGYNQTSVLLPLIVALPNYFGKVFLLGGLIQSLTAFGKVQDALSFLVSSYSQIAQWRAISQRLTSFINHLHDAEEKAEKEDKVSISEHKKDSINAHDITIKTPHNEPLLANINEEFIHGKNYLIQGESGMGKSTFVRTLAGIWPYASGDIQLSDSNTIMFLPQKSYMPMGTLEEAILFPDKKNPDLSQKLIGIMHECHLDNLIPHLNEIGHWSEQLSPGELQRVAFVRILLHKPRWVFLDETTSMLDLANEEYLYKLLKKHLPDCSLVSVGHRPSLEKFHDYVIDMKKYSHQQINVNQMA